MIILFYVQGDPFEIFFFVLLFFSLSKTSETRRLVEFWISETSKHFHYFYTIKLTHFVFYPLKPQRIRSKFTTVDEIVCDKSVSKNLLLTYIQTMETVEGIWLGEGDGFIRFGDSPAFCSRLGGTPFNARQTNRGQVFLKYKTIAFETYMSLCTVLPVTNIVPLG